MNTAAPPKKPGRPKLLLNPEQESQRKERRRRQLAEAQARRRTRLTGALEQVDGASQANKEIQGLLALVKTLQASVSWHEDRQAVLERELDRKDAENKKLRSDIRSSASGSAKEYSQPTALAGRVETIVQEMTTYSSGKEVVWLEGYAKLVKKWAVDAKSTATKVETILAVTTGGRAIEGKGLATSRFASPVLSEEENRVLTQAMLVLGRIAGDVDSAAHKVASLHKQREMERLERLKKAGLAMEIFDNLDLDNKILLVAMQYTRLDTGWGAFHDLVRGIDRPENRDRWWKATKHFEDSYKERRNSIARQLADAMKDSGRTADDLAGEAFQKFQDLKPKIEQEWPNLARKLKTEMVAERLGK